MNEEKPEFKITKRQVWAGTLICFVFIIVSCIMLLNVMNIAKNNPCLACSKLTTYVCINKTDLPPFWKPDIVWEEIHNANGNTTPT